MSTFRPVNYFREAFVHPLNIGIVLIGAMTAFFLSEWGIASHVILSLLIGLELTYLGIVPNLPRFRNRVRRRKAENMDHSSREKNIFESLDQNSRRRFLVLKHITKLIRENFDRLPYSSQGLLKNIRNKVTDLLTNYLQLLELNHRYREYISRTDEEELKQEIQNEEEQIQDISSDKLRKSRQRRLNILTKRLEKLQLAKENNQVCESHLETIEDAIRYIYEQSMTMSDPQKIGYQLDNLLSEVEETSEIVDELDNELVPIDEEIDDLDFEDDIEGTGETESDDKTSKNNDNHNTERDKSLTAI